MKSIDLAVIGAGPAGLSAAVTASRAGLEVALIDERPAPGGQYLGGAEPPVTACERRGRALLDQLPGCAVDWHGGTLVWDLSASLQLSLYGPRGAEQIRARAVIVAGGGRELVLPFPGWTLPGVMTAGAAQLLVNKYGVLPGRRALVAGAGPLLLPAACALARMGAQIHTVLEVTRPASRFLRAPARGLSAANWERAWEGWLYLTALRRARVPYLFGWAVVRALGEGRLEAAVLAKVDDSGRVTVGTERTAIVDVLCVGHGLLPNTDLTQAAGCAHHWDPALGGMAPVLDSNLETNVPGLYVAGESGGIGGASVAMVEGQMAALLCAAGMGRADRSRETPSAAWRPSGRDCGGRRSRSIPSS